MRNLLRFLILTIAGSLLFAISVFGNPGNPIDPSNPGDTPETAWLFNNSMNVTQSFQINRPHHIYRIDVSAVPDYTFRLTFNSRDGAHVQVFRENGDIADSIVFSAGQHTRYLYLGVAAYYVEVWNLNLSDQIYTIQLRPYIGNQYHQRTQNGSRVEIVDNRLLVNGRSVLPNTTAILDNYFRTGAHWIPNLNTTFSTNVVRFRDGNRALRFFCLQRNTLVNISGNTLGDVFTFTNFYTTMVRDSERHPLNIAQTPNHISVNFQNQALNTNGGAGLQISVNDGRTWSALNYPFDITSRIPAVSREDSAVLIRYRGTNMFLASEPVEIILPARPSAAPTSTFANFDGFTETILFSDDTVEYRQGTTGAWTRLSVGQAYTNVTLGTGNTTYQVRFAGSDTYFPSLSTNITVPRRRVEPSAVYDPASDSITGVANTMEFSVDGGDTWTRLTASSIPRETLGQDAVTVYVRLAATAAQGVSETRIIQVPNGPAVAPTGFEIDFVREVLTGVVPGMQSSTNGTSWTNIAANELNIASFIPAATAAPRTLFIRVGATATAPPSIPAEITLIPRVPALLTANVRFDGFAEAILINDTMEFRQGTTGAWTAATSGQTYVPVTLMTSTAVWQVRTRGTGDEFPSATLEITVPRRRVEPNAVFSTATNNITSVAATMEFSLDGGNTWTRSTSSPISRDILGENAITVYVRLAATAAQGISETRIIEVPAGSAVAPTGFEIDYAREILTGVAPGMQSSTNGTSWTNITTYELNIANFIPAATAAPRTLFIRVAPTATAPASVPAEITLIPRVPALLTANVRFDGFTESILLDDTMEFRLGATGDWTDVPTGQTSMDVTLTTSTAAWQVRTKGTDTTFPSAILSITVPRRRVEPNATFSTTTNNITGVTTAMEFSLDGGNTWTRSAATTISRAVFGENATTVYVRLAATAAQGISETRVIEVPAGSVVAPTGFEIDYAREILTGVASNMQWSTNGTRWNNITDSELDISGMIPAATATANANLRIRIAPTQTMPPSEYYSIPLIPRAATPATSVARFDGLTETVMFNDTMEYRLGTTGPWTAATPGQTYMPVNIGTSSVRWYVRVRGTDNTFPSLGLRVTVPVRPAAPRAIYNIAQDTITGVTAAMEFAIGSQANWTSVESVPLTRQQFGSDAATIYVRTRATATAAYGHYATVNIPDAVSSPVTYFTIDFAREILNGVTADMEFATRAYVLVDGIAQRSTVVPTRWTRITAAQAADGLILTSLIPAWSATARPTELLVRNVATDGNPSSVATSFTINHRPRTPLAANASFNGFEERILVNDSAVLTIPAFEFRAGTIATTPWSAGYGNGFDVSPQPATGVVQTYQVRIAPDANAQTFASLTFNVTVPRRPASPLLGATRVRYDILLDNIRSVTAAMEFSTDNGATWADTGGTTISRAQLGINASELQVRIRATATAPHSDYVVVSVPAQPSVPNISGIDFNSEVLLGVTSAMQISINGGSTWLAVGPIRDGGMCLVSRIPAAGRATVNIMVRYAPTDVSPGSAVTESFVIHARPATPAAAAHRFDAATATMAAIGGIHQYSLDGGNTWRDVTGDAIELPAGPARSVLVRVAPQGGLFASIARSVSVPVVVGVLEMSIIYTNSLDDNDSEFDAEMDLSNQEPPTTDETSSVPDEEELDANE